MGDLIGTFRRMGITDAGTFLTPGKKRMGITDAGTFLTPGKKRGDLKNLWTRGVPERPCPHVQDEHSQEFNEEK